MPGELGDLPARGATRFPCGRGGESGGASVDQATVKPANEPTAVILTIEDDNGMTAEMELIFPTRFQAEWFVFQLPYLGIEQVKAAILSPLVPT